MNLTSSLYIFALAVLCNPGVFTKHRSPSYVIYSLIFSFILYITFEFINIYTENYEQYNVDVKGVDSLVDLLKIQGGNDESKQIDIHNNFSQEDGNGNDANCWNALGKNQKELEIIKVQLDSYSGTKESTDTLNKQLNEQKKEIETLEEALKEFHGTKGEIDLLNIQIGKYQDEIDDLKDKLFVYNQTEKSIGEVNKKISNLQTNITDLNTNISNCNTLNGKNQATINKLKIDIGNQEIKMGSLQRRIDAKEGCEPTTLLFTSSGSSKSFSNRWSGWYNAGNHVNSGEGKRSAYDTLPLRKIRIVDSDGNDLIWELDAQYKDKSMVSIIGSILPNKEKSQNNGTSTWTNGHAPYFGRLIQNLKNKANVHSYLRIGVGDGTRDSRDWAVFMPMIGNCGRDFAGRSCYDLGGESKTSDSSVRTISLYGG